jgi:DNA-binding NarL/FixJ family response regulator
VLVALSRPLLDSPHGAPASNREIADELVLSVDTVKSTLSALFVRFGLTGLPQNAKRVSLAARAVELLSADRSA